MGTLRSFIERFWIPAIALSLAVTAWIVFVGEGIDAYYRSRLVDMVQGTAYRPYVYRVLVPGLARVATAAFPTPTAMAMVVATIMGVSLIGFGAGVRALSRGLFSTRPIVHALTALVAIACLPLTFGPFSRQIYDFTTLCSITWSLVLLLRRQWLGYVLAFALACLNKESAILLALVFAVFAARGRLGLSRGHAFGLFTAQLAIAIGVRALVMYAFRDNPGDSVEIHLFGHNLYVLTHPSEMSLRLLLLIGVALVGLWSWRSQPEALRLTFAVLAPAMLLMGLTVGVIDEVRAFYEIYAVVVVMAAFTVTRALGVVVEPA